MWVFGGNVLGVVSLVVDCCKNYIVEVVSVLEY